MFLCLVETFSSPGTAGGASRPRAGFFDDEHDDSAEFLKTWLLFANTWGEEEF
jgi:hypothetical protein